MLLIPTDVYDDEGNLTQIEFYNEKGEFVIQAQWDPRDEQTSENRIKFREWAYRIVSQDEKYEVLK
jgi:hypothetical protein